MSVTGRSIPCCEPNAVLNLTCATTFAEFASEIREGGESHILAMPQYERSRRIRLIETMWDILREYPGGSRRFWFDRVFYQQDDGTVCPLSACWEVRPPRIIRTFLGIMKTLESSNLRPILHAAFEKGE